MLVLLSLLLACDSDGDGFKGKDDCDNGSAAVNPDAVDTCNGIDDDCDGKIDEAPPTWYADSDGDGFGDEANPTEACGLPSGYAANADDCDDSDASVHPSAIEVCNDGVDDDCDGLADGDDDSLDAASSTLYYADTDGDGFGDNLSSRRFCSEPADHVLDNTDCDDGAAAVNPAATEVCNDGVDDDCDGLSDDTDDSLDMATTSTWYADDDADGFGRDADTLAACAQPSGYAGAAGDCDDAAASAYPGGAEVCDGLDNDCDGLFDDQDDSVDLSTLRDYYADTDSDGYGDIDDSQTSCSPPSGYVADSSDCDDDAAIINPGATEVCNGGVDDDCDGLSDDADSAVDLSTGSTYYLDGDTDGYGDPASSTAACEAPSGYTSDASDCDDGDAAIHPAATEICDLADNDCDGDIDDADSSVDTSTGSTWYADSDSDGFGDAATSVAACLAPSGYGANDTDCDDADASTFPGAAASDSTTDCMTDADGDGYGSDAPGSGVVAGTDCDDAVATAYPGATEVCDGADSDCDGTTAELAVPGDYSTIQSAIDAASSGDWVCVADGTYAETLDFGAKELTLESQNGSASTTVDGSTGSGTILTIDGGQTSASSVSGFAFTGVDSKVGGAIVLDGASPVFSDIVISDNSYSCSGSCTGMIYAYDSESTFSELVIRDNSVSLSGEDTLYGLGFYVEYSSLEISDYDFMANSVNTTGGDNAVAGLALYADSSLLIIERMDVRDNAYSDVGGSDLFAGMLYSDRNLTYLENAIFAGNSSDAQVVAGLAICSDSSDDLVLSQASITGNAMTGTSGNFGTVYSAGLLEALNSDLSNNTTNDTGNGAGWHSSGLLDLAYCNTYNNGTADFDGSATDPTGTDGNVSTDPGYKDTTAADAEDWDLSLDTGSALIDAGDTGLLDSDGSGSDIGAYGGENAGW